MEFSGFPQDFSDYFSAQTCIEKMNKVSSKASGKIKKTNKGISKNTRESYKKVSNQARSQLIFLVESCHLSLKAATEALGIKYSTGKSILTLYRKEGRILKKINCGEASPQNQVISESPVLAIMGIQSEKKSPLSPALEQFCSTVASSSSSHCESEVDYPQNFPLNKACATETRENSQASEHSASYSESYHTSEESFLDFVARSDYQNENPIDHFTTNCEAEWSDSVSGGNSVESDEAVDPFMSFNRVIFE
mmetsp:Transcript_53123/g.60887  ORF Transcript_53123/g.60887 Transcript_53123/m.60887 type:complete len:251 (-) Transcript_53123:457-1209(-)